MVEEWVTHRNDKFKINIVSGKMKNILKSSSVKTGLRLYDGSNIGIASAIGSYDKKELVSRAESMFKHNIFYTAMPAAGLKRAEDFSSECKVSYDELIEGASEIINLLDTQSSFSCGFGNIIFQDVEISIGNSGGAELVYRDAYVSSDLLLNHNRSTNIFDMSVVYKSRRYDKDGWLKMVSDLCGAYDNQVSVSTKTKIPVVFKSGPDCKIFGKFFDLHGINVAEKASIFSDKIGEQLFSSNFSLSINRNSAIQYIPFFDGEGTVLENDKFVLIDKGVIKYPYTDKMTALKYDYPRTSSASFAYDQVPDIGFPALYAEPSPRSMSELLAGQEAVLIDISQGGGFTSEGNFAAPVQSSFLFDGENIIGRLPELTISSNLYDMFGKDFVGVIAEGLYSGDLYGYLIVNMNVETNV